MAVTPDISSVKHDRADPDRSEWPGRAVCDFAEDRIREAAGDPADMFTYEQRLAAHKWIEAAHWYNWRNNNRPDYTFKLIFLVGKKGQGKSLTAIYHCSQLYAAGLPFFHNGSGLFGNELGLLDLFDLLDKGPRGGCFWFDEIHTINQTNRELSTAQMTQVESIAGMRKRDYWGAIGTSIPGMVGRRMRGEVDEIWMPNKLEVRYTKATAQGGAIGDIEGYYSWGATDRLRRGQRRRVSPCDDRDNFQYVVNKMSENPWRDNSVYGLFEPELLQKPRRGQVAEPKPYYTQKMKPSWLRLSMMLLDSFLPLKLGVGVAAAALTKDVKERLLSNDNISVDQNAGVISNYQVAAALMHAFNQEILRPEGCARATELIQAGELGGQITVQRLGHMLGSDWEILKGPGARDGFDLRSLHDFLLSALRSDDDDEE